MAGDSGAGQHHFLVVVFPGQGHINPSLHLAGKLTALGHRATISTPVFAHRGMFPAAGGTSPLPLDDPHDPLLSFYPHSDGFDDGFDWINGDPIHLLSLNRDVGARSLREVARSLAALGRPVTCVIYGINSAWTVNVARDLGVPAVAFWVQPAAVLAVYYHYFHGYKDAVDRLWKDAADGHASVVLPGLPPLQGRDIPSILGPNNEYKGVFKPMFEELFRVLDESQQAGSRCRTRLLVNSVSSLEDDAFGAVDGALDVVAVGPLISPVLTLPDSGASGNLRRPQTDADMVKATSDAYLGWLNSQQAERSVVYISFGSYGVVVERQIAELARALVDCGRPYLWVTRGDVKLVREALTAAIAATETKERRTVPEGMVVEWCSQVKVLSHRSVGCFLTHCGWNSTMEALAAGVPIVGIPQWADQPTIAKMVESVWGAGVRVAADVKKGVVAARELSRSMDLVMGGGEEAGAIRRKAMEWSWKMREAAGDGGLSERRLAEFVAGISQP